MKSALFFFCLILTVATSFSQTKDVTITGLVNDQNTRTPLQYVNVVVKNAADSLFVIGTVTDEAGRFTLNVSPGKYLLELSFSGYQMIQKEMLVGQLSEFLDLGQFHLSYEPKTLQGVTITANQQGVSSKMDKKTYSLSENVSQTGGSVLQAMKSLPGISVDQEGKVQLRGSDRLTILVDGKQTALTGFGNQAGLDNIPASAIERIEIINNPSAKYDASGNAGIINIIYKKEKQDGFNGKIGLSTGLGALVEKKENLPTIRSQYSRTPKLNPSLSVNYRKSKVNIFLQADGLWEKTLNKNEFSERTYSNGDIIRQQVKRNRITTEGSAKLGMDWNIDENNMFTISGLFSREKVIDRGDIPYFNGDLSDRKRLWQFFEDEINSAATASAGWQHKFRQPGHLLNFSFNYTFHREDEKYFLTNIMPTFTGKDTFMLIADEHVSDFSIDYVRPLRQGRIESGVKFRNRYIPTNMQFFPGENSPLDVNASGWANYREIIPAVYTNYVYENKKFELEAGLRIEYVDLKYTVNPNHNTYSSDGYTYTRPFPSVRAGYKINDNNKVSVFFNRRVDRPDEGDIRIFPKYDDPEILKVGNPALRPQFTNTFEMGYKTNWTKGYLYGALYYRATNATISRIGTTVPGNTIIYSIYQNTGRSYNQGIELVFQQEINAWFSFNANVNLYKNTINAFTIENKYPVPSIYSAEKENFNSGNVKLNTFFHLLSKFQINVTAIYQAPDIIPQGKTDTRFLVDAGMKKTSRSGKSEWFINGSDILNTLRVRKEITGNGFHITSTDYYETQVLRIGYNYKF